MEDAVIWVNIRSVCELQAADKDLINILIVEHLVSDSDQITGYIGANFGIFYPTNRKVFQFFYFMTDLKLLLWQTEKHISQKYIRTF